MSNKYHGENDNSSRDLKYNKKISKKYRIKNKIINFIINDIFIYP